MLFHVTTTHSAENCPDAYPEKMKIGVGTVETVKSTGIKVKAAYHDAPGHTTYFVVEAETAEQLWQFLKPAAAIGNCDVHPVIDM